MNAVIVSVDVTATASAFQVPGGQGRMDAEAEGGAGAGEGLCASHPLHTIPASAGVRCAAQGINCGPLTSHQPKIH